MATINPSLLDLPDEILQNEILARCSCDALSRMSLVCQKFNDLLSSDSPAWLGPIKREFPEANQCEGQTNKEFFYQTILQNSTAYKVGNVIGGATRKILTRGPQVLAIGTAGAIGTGVIIGTLGLIGAMAPIAVIAEIAIGCGISLVGPVQIMGLVGGPVVVPGAVVGATIGAATAGIDAIVSIAVAKETELLAVTGTVALGATIRVLAVKAGGPVVVPGTVAGAAIAINALVSGGIGTELLAATGTVALGATIGVLAVKSGENGAAAMKKAGLVGGAIGARFGERIQKFCLRSALKVAKWADKFCPWGTH